MNPRQLHQYRNKVFVNWKINPCDPVNGFEVKSLRVKKVKTVIQKSKDKRIAVALCPCVNEGRKERDAIVKEKYAERYQDY